MNSLLTREKGDNIMGSQINNNIAEAIDVLISKRLGDLKLDTTIIAEISSIIDSKEGKYKVKYQSAIFEAYVEEKDKTFRVGQSVYVRIPQSDFSQKKVITGRADNNTSEIAKQNLLNYHFVLEPTFHFLSAEQVLTANKQNKLEIPITPSVYDEISFLKFANEYSYIQIEASFKAQFQKAIDKGNYGIKVYFNAFDNADQEYCLTLDTYSFNGRFYNFASGTKQTKIFQIQRSFLKGVKRIEFFVENFDEETANTEIKVRDVKINFVDILDISQDEYYTKIQGLDGFLFKNKDLSLAPLKFSATLLKEGKNVTKDEKYLYRWFYYGLNEQGKLDWHEFNINEETKEPLSTSDIVIYNFEENSRIYNLEVYSASDPSTILTSNSFRVENAETPEITFEVLPMGINVFFKDSKYKGIWYKNDVRINNVAQTSYLIANTEFTTDILDIDCDIYTNEDIKDQNGEKIFSAGDYIGSWTKNFYYKDTYDNFKINFVGNKIIQYPRVGNFETDIENNYFSLEYSYEEVEEKTINSISYYLNDIVILNKENKQNEDNKQENNSLLKNIYYDEVEHYKKVNIYYDLDKQYDFSKKDTILKIIIDFTSGAKFEYKYKLECVRKDSSGIASAGYSCRLVPSHDFYCGQSDYKLNLEVYKHGEPQTITEKDIVFETAKINDNNIINPGLSIKLNKQDLKDKKSGNLVVVAISYNNYKIAAYYPIPIGTSRTAYFEIEPISSVQYSAAGLNPKPNVSTAESGYTPSVSFNFTKSGSNSYYIEQVLEYKNGINQEIIYQPIICYLKPEEITENVPTNWDGQIVLNTSNNIISALRVSGGRGNEAKFSGVTIGTMANGENLQNGIFGYSNGQGTFKITETGIAYFGKDGGDQVKIDGANQQIQGYATSSKTHILALNLAATAGENLIEGMSNGRSKFSVSANGGAWFDDKVEMRDLIVNNDAKIGKNIELTTHQISVDTPRELKFGKKTDSGQDMVRAYIKAEDSKTAPTTPEAEKDFLFPQIEIHTLAVNSTEDLIIGGKTFEQILREIYKEISNVACKCNSSDE